MDEETLALLLALVSTRKVHRSRVREEREVQEERRRERAGAPTPSTWERVREVRLGPTTLTTSLIPLVSKSPERSFQKSLSPRFTSRHSEVRQLGELGDEAEGGVLHFRGVGEVVEGGEGGAVGGQQVHLLLGEEHLGQGGTELLQGQLETWWKVQLYSPSL